MDPTPPRAAHSFSSVVYGDVATLVSHCLAFADLAAWSSVNRDGRAAVRYKFDHCGLLNIATIPNITLEHFKTLCDRLRGVQVILLPTSHPCLLTPAPEIRAAQDELQYSVQSEGLAMLLELMTANAAWLTAVTFIHPALPSTASQCRCEMEVCQALTKSMHRWSNCTLIPRAYPLPLDASRQIIERYQNAKHASLAEVGSAHPAASSPIASPSQLSLSVNSGEMLLDLSHLWPSLETLEISFTEQAEQTDHEHFDANFNCVQQAVNNFQSLLALQLQFNGSFMPRNSVLSLHLPHVLQLMLIDHADAGSGLGDLDLDCPRLMGLNLPVAFSGSFGRPLFAPPLMLSTLAKSTRLRALALINLSQPGAVPNLSETLSAEQRSQLDAKAAALGQPSLFTDPVDPARVFVYWLSTLPFARGLEMFEDFPTCVSIEEVLALFPSLRGYCVSPPYCFHSENWLRPTWAEDPLNFEQAPHWREQGRIRAWDRLASKPQESAEEFSKRMNARPPVSLSSSLSIAMPNTKLESAACIRLLQSSAMFASLRIVFLAAPCEVEEAAVQSLLLQCAELHSLSLIQLDNLGDQVFLDLPASFTKPTLRTLRIKGQCDARSPQLSQRSCFTNRLVLKLPSLFPELEHIEVITGQLSQGAQLSQLLQAPGNDASGALESTKLLRLRTLVVDPPRNRQEMRLVERAWFERHESVCRTDPSAASSAWRLDFVQLDEPLSEELYDVSDDWPTHNRIVQRRAAASPDADAAERFIAHSVRVCLEAMCVSMYCRVHRNFFAQAAEQIEPDHEAGADLQHEAFEEEQH